MLSFREETRYSWSWGLKRVDEFLGKYARATWKLAEITEIPTNILVKKLNYLITHDQKRWEIAKKIIKEIHRDIEADPKSGAMVLGSKGRRNYLTNVHLRALGLKKASKI